MPVIPGPGSFVFIKKITQLCDNSLKPILTDDTKEIKHYKF